jgi:hypothetical protein
MATGGAARGKRPIGGAVTPLEHSHPDALGLCELGGKGAPDDPGPDHHNASAFHPHRSAASLPGEPVTLAGQVRCVGSVRGSPKCGNTLLSAKKVISATLLPASVSTRSPYGRPISVCGQGK